MNSCFDLICPQLETWEMFLQDFGLVAVEGAAWGKQSCCWRPGHCSCVKHLSTPHLGFNSGAVCNFGCYRLRECILCISGAVTGHRWRPRVIVLEEFYILTCPCEIVWRNLAHRYQTLDMHHLTGLITAGYEWKRLFLMEHCPKTTLLHTHAAGPD